MIKNIIFDFDGVILDSVPVKTKAFQKLFEQFDKSSVDKLVDYHLVNGGKSRYIKIKYFFNEILNKSISEKEILKYADDYSKLTKEELSKKKYLITDTSNFIKHNYNNYNIHVASGADEQDLKFICKSLNLNQYFLSINGSPKVKNDIVNDILVTNNYIRNQTVLIGDSENDYEAAYINRIKFYGFNNLDLIPKGNYIYTFSVDFTFNE